MWYSNKRLTHSIISGDREGDPGKAEGGGDDPPEGAQRDALPKRVDVADGEEAEKADQKVDPKVESKPATHTVLTVLFASSV